MKLKTSLKFDVEIKASLQIYDKGGNRVKSIPVQSGIGMVELQWNGTNERQRLVGKGTYLRVFFHSTESNGVEEIKKPQKIWIGVK